jgi:hypothetical protein
MRDHVPDPSASPALAEEKALLNRFARRRSWGDRSQAFLFIPILTVVISYTFNRTITRC